MEGKLILILHLILFSISLKYLLDSVTSELNNLGNTFYLIYSCTLYLTKSTHFGICIYYL